MTFNDSGGIGGEKKARAWNNNYHYQKLHYHVEKSSSGKYLMNFFWKTGPENIHKGPPDDVMLTKVKSLLFSVGTSFHGHMAGPPPTYGADTNQNGIGPHPKRICY